jgi:hypothetical protein
MHPAVDRYAYASFIGGSNVLVGHRRARRVSTVKLVLHMTEWILATMSYLPLDAAIPIKIDLLICLRFHGL